MKLPLILENHRLVLPATVFLEQSDRIARVKFILDTGARESFMGGRDISNLQLQQPATKPFVSLKIGGEILNLVRISGIKIILFSENETLQIIPKEFSAPMEALTNVNKLLHIPSIIGMKFLAEQKLSLILRPHKNIAYLETD